MIQQAGIKSSKGRKEIQKDLIDVLDSLFLIEIAIQSTNFTMMAAVG
jgi:hypothetical protein